MNTTTDAATAFDFTDEFVAAAEAAEAAGVELELVHNVNAHTFWLMLQWGEDETYPSAFVYMFEDGSTLACPAPLCVPVGPNELAALVAINGVLDGGLVAGMRVRADRDKDEGFDFPHWRQLADRVAEADGRFTDKHYAKRYRALARRIAADEKARYARRKSAA